MNPVLMVAAAGLVASQVHADDDLDDAVLLTRVPRLTKQLRKKIRKLVPRSLNPTPRGQRRPAGTGRPQARNVTFINNETDFLDETGLSADQFDHLYRRMLQRLLGPRITADGPKRRTIARTWAPMTRLLLVLRWLRHLESYRRLAKVFGGSAATVCREIWDVIPKLYIELQNELQLPSAQEVTELPHFSGASGVTDCTAHLRNRVHPWSTEYYRGDLHEHFITAQQTCALSGNIWDVQLAPGHNNDQAMFNNTDMETTILARNTRLLADLGYTSDAVIRPDDLGELGSELRSRHGGFRSVVEQNFALVHMFAAASLKFRASPEKQEMVLMIVYALVHIKCAQRPLRANINQ